MLAAPLVAAAAALLIADLNASPDVVRQNAVADGVKQALAASTQQFAARADAAKLNGGSGGVLDVPAALAAFRASRVYSVVQRSSISATVVSAFAGLAAGVVITLFGVFLVTQARQLGERRRVRALAGVVSDE